MSDDNILHFPSEAGEVREMTRWQKFRDDLRRWFVLNVSRRIPRLVWYGQEIDVTISFDIPPVNDGMAHYFNARDALRGAGIEFDSGSGMGQADWEFDWSLRGPAHVIFRGRARLPENRGWGDPITNT